MQEQIYSSLVLLSVFIPIIIFSVVGMSANLKPKRFAATSTQNYVNDFLTSSQQASQGDFINSSVGYMLQISTTIWFIYWGYAYGFSNIIHVMTWAFGIYLFSKASNTLLENRLNDNESLPALISRGTFGAIRKLASLATIISFLGIFFVESYFASNFVSTMTLTGNITSTPADSYWWFYFIILVLSTLLYSLSGGYRKVMANDTWQLAFAYLGFALAFAYLIPITASSNATTSVLLAAIVLIVYVYLLLRSLSDDDGKPKVNSLLVSCFVIFLSIVLTFTRATTLPWKASVSVPGIFAQAQDKFGIITILGFSVVNIIYQFCDNSNFERIAALNLCSDSLQDQRNVLRKSLRAILVVSPLTWGFGILLGMMIRASGLVPVASQNSDSQFLQFISIIRSSALDGNGFAFAVIIGLSSAFISIMMSTADVAILAALHSVALDFKLTKILASSNRFFLGVILSLLCFVFAYYVRLQSDQTFIFTVVSAANACILILAIPAIIVISKTRIHSLSVSLSMIFGLLGIAWATFFPPPIHTNILVVLPYFMMFAGGILGILSGQLIATSKDFI